MTDTLLTPRDIRDLAARGGVHPSKQRGQNFLMDPNTVRAIVQRAGVREGETVLEVGPGLGSLTLGLLEAGASVVAVELDRGLVQLLPQTLAERGIDADRIALMHADALTVTELPIPAGGAAPVRLVANLPYNVATPILLTMLERFTQLRDALVMVQSEVVDRLVAGPGSRTYGSPSVKVAWYGSAERSGTISRQVFWPVPNVDSALVQVVRRDVPLGDETDRRETFAVVDAAFAQRRKTLRAALAGWAGSAARAGDLLAAAGIDPSRRGETLEVEDFLAIVRAAREVSP
ncbi:16S rRNA (adenine(1518)-N(6)/adenine(1519)-N(6))-dimethyltransferase RsmA [Brachybacterium sp. AOP25-B2-12]|uniref:16S rRNA (adenine(1518)-N(6)/adenine(1519)-N(6))- dimethyltransferase RsmA n=1 Tax=Brachybacterium sp. AOP25-B2-12 TaxID=3457710 RepID=UPI004033D70D